MTPTPDEGYPRAGLPLAVAETDRIAALLAEVMPHAAPPMSLPPEAVNQNVQSSRRRRRHRSTRKRRSRPTPTP